MVTDGKPILVKKTVIKKEVPPDLAVLKVLKQIYDELDLYKIKGEQKCIKLL